jgi:hypothetical protein
VADVKIYRLYLSVILRLTIYAATVIPAVMGLVFLSGVFASADGKRPPRIIGVFLLVPFRAVLVESSCKI